MRVLWEKWVRDRSPRGRERCRERAPRTRLRRKGGWGCREGPGSQGRCRVSPEARVQGFRGTPASPTPWHRARPTSSFSPNPTPFVVRRSSAGKRSLAGSTDWPTSAPAFPSYRAASPRSGSRPRPCSPASARSCRTNWRRPRTPPRPPPWPAPRPAPGPGATPNSKRLQSPPPKSCLGQGTVS